MELNMWRAIVDEYLIQFTLHLTFGHRSTVLVFLLHPMLLPRGYIPPVTLFSAITLGWQMAWGSGLEDFSQFLLLQGCQSRWEFDIVLDDEIAPLAWLLR